ncbi:MAG: hypothetical protein M3Y42_14640 [Actinomycetota bacterium]|nr:hypothetical protein [Actinomycetota bacterium]MDQ2958188.1 hypothetical protein [Actinomycetota bacterium]
MKRILGIVGVFVSVATVLVVLPTTSEAAPNASAAAHSSTFSWTQYGTSRSPTAGWILDSSDNTHHVQFQPDGNWVVYHGSTPTWASNTSNVGIGLVFASSPGDEFGNIFITKNGGDAWQNNVHGYNQYSTMRVVMQNDGNFVEYPGSSGGSAIWATNTNGK